MTVNLVSNSALSIHPEYNITKKSKWKTPNNITNLDLSLKIIPKDLWEN